MAAKVLIEKNDGFVTFYVGEAGKDIIFNSTTNEPNIHHIYDIRLDVPIVIKTHPHETKNFIRIITNDIETDSPGGSIVQIKSGEGALRSNPKYVYDNIYELRTLLLEYFKK
jgi:hypothetical protein